VVLEDLLWRTCHPCISFRQVLDPYRTGAARIGDSPAIV
jgi:hypothetical protein